MSCCVSWRMSQRDNLFVNFDPANMILYGVGEPLEALETLGSWVRSVHCKDATGRPSQGSRGARKSHWARGTSTLPSIWPCWHKIGYQGPLTIERELSQEPERQKAEIAAAVTLLNRLKI